MGLAIFITGRAGCGKTTLVKKLLPNLPQPTVGFYTEEIRDRGNRVGFLIQAIRGVKGVLADLSPGAPRVGKYRVRVEEFEELVLPELAQPAVCCVIDEIGKMELHSQKFRALLPDLTLRFPILLATRALFLPEEIERIWKNASDVRIFTLTPTNREEIYQKVRLHIQEI